MKKIITNGIVAALVVGVSVSATAFAFGNTKEKNSSQPGTEVVVEPAEIVTEAPATQPATVVKTIEEPIVRGLSVAPDVESVTKDDIFHMMLNTIDYFNKASGTFMFSCGNPDNVTVIDFQTNMPESASYSRMTVPSSGNTDSPESEIISFCQKSGNVTVNATEKSWSRTDFSGFTLEDAVPIKDEDRITTAPDGMPCYSYRSNPTNVEFSSMCLLLQEITIGFLEDQELWEIEGVKEFSGLDCYVIHGKTSEDYGAKLNVAEFEFLVDVNTGVLVRYEGFDANGNLSDFMYTENLKFDDCADEVNAYSKSLIDEYMNAD